ncbi:MAG TPA: phosphoglycerate mutase family protein [Pyrinomonadaceae bacterium]|nr:phosphoglycerate mutase family protein [Pyrinomonadaceae bacterium]
MAQTGGSKFLLYAVILLLLAGLLAAGGVVYLQRQPPTTILLVRHAERQDAPPALGECPPPGLGLQNSTGTSITEAGRERAAELAHVAGEAGVSAIYVSEVCRSQWTAKPLADRAGATVIQLNAADVQGLVNHIRENQRGRTVVVSSHTDRIPQIISALGASPAPTVADTDYDNLWVITVPRWGSPRLMLLKYGRET